jgi:hypothetical protein
MPADVRKAFGLPARKPSDLGYAQLIGGGAPNSFGKAGRKRKALPHIRRHSRVESITFCAKLFTISKYEIFQFAQRTELREKTRVLVVNKPDQSLIQSILVVGQHRAFELD